MSCGWGWWKLGWVGSIPRDGVKNGGIGDVLWLGLGKVGLEKTKLGTFHQWGWWDLGWVDPNPRDGVKNGGIRVVLWLGSVEFGLGWFHPMGWGQKAQNWGHSTIGVGGIRVVLVPIHGMGSKMVNLGMSCGWGWWKLGWVGLIPWDGVKNGGIGDVLTLGLVEVGLGWLNPMGWGQKW